MHPNGDLIDGFYLFKSTGASADRGTSIAAIRSTDKGASWSKKAIAIAPAHSIGETDPEPINCRPFITGNPPCTLVRSDGVILDLAVDYSCGPHAGRIYVTWQDHQDNPYGDDLILLSHSDDAGQTWSAPVKVNQTPSATFTDQAWEPAVHVNSDGVVAVSYYDFRNDVSGDRRLTTDHWIVHSHDGGATWSEDHLARAVRPAPGAVRPRLLRRRLPGPRLAGHGVPALFTLANPGSDTVFPNPNPTDEFINSAF